MKKLVTLVLALALVLCATAAMADPITLTYAEVNPLDTIVGKIATDFKSKVEELSGGEVIIDVQASGVLGSEAQILDGILGGGDTVDQLRLRQGDPALHPVHLCFPRALLELRRQRAGAGVPC